LVILVSLDSLGLLETLDRRVESEILVQSDVPDRTDFLVQLEKRASISDFIRN